VKDVLPLKRVALIKKGFCDQRHVVADYDRKAKNKEVIERVLEVFHSGGILSICVADASDAEKEGYWRHIALDTIREWTVREA
jgi:spore germination protein YaaH